MPRILLNKNDVLTLVGKKISDKELENSIPLLGTDLNSVTKDSIDVEIFPNRPDMLSEEGFARALSSFLGIKIGLKDYVTNKSDYHIINEKKSGVEFFSAAVVKGLKFTESSLKSLMNLQEKLHATHGRNRKRLATGVYDLSKIKFPLVLTSKPRSFEFQALDDKKPRSIDEILEKHPKGKNFSHLVKDKASVWMDANGQVLSMPPVINSEPTKVSLNTHDVFIEVTGNNKDAVEKALNIQLSALADRGGKIYKIDGMPNLSPLRIKINVERINNLLGLNLSKREFSLLASKMGLKFSDDYVYYPAYRADILHEVDIAEDIAIAYGYQNFTPVIPSISTLGQEDLFERFKDKIANLCIGLGLQEVCTYHLSNRTDETTKMNKTFDVVNIKNSISEEYNILRPWLVPSLIKVLASNCHNEYPQRIFDIGKIFVKKNSDVNEPVSLTVAISHSTTDYTEIKKILDAILLSLGITPNYKQGNHLSFIPGRFANVSIKNNDIAFIGEIHPEILNNFNISMPITVFELNLSEIFKIVY